MLRGKVVVDQGRAVHHTLYIWRAGRDPAEKVKVEYQAFVDAVPGDPRVQYPAMDENELTGAGLKILFIQHQSFNQFSIR